MSEKRHITIITANYYPEDTAIGLYTNQFSRFLVEKNMAVTVITGFPCYPQWAIYEDYKALPNFVAEEVNGVKIIRYKQYVPEEVTFKGRVKMMLSLFYGTFRNITKIPQTDLVISIIPYTLSALPAFFLAKRKKAKLWIHIQDFEFDLALDSDVLNKENFFFKILKKSIFSFESYLLNKANIVSSISFRMLEKVQQKSKQKNNYYFPNWVSSENINPNKFTQHPYIDKNKFTLLYSGNIGEKQDWAFLKELCQMLVEKKSIEVVIVGSGSYKNKLYHDLKAFPFVKFFEPIPYEELNNLLCSANVHFLFQKTKVVDTIMPSKILGMMASEKPSIITVNEASEVGRIMEKSEGGSYFYKNSVLEVFLEIEKLSNNTDLCETTGINARKFILTNFSEEKILNDLYSKIEKELS